MHLAFPSFQPTGLLNVCDFPIAKRSKFVDIHKVDGTHPFRCLAEVVAVKVVRAVPYNKHNQLLDQLESIVTSSDYSITRICPFFVENVTIGNEIVKTCVSPWFENGGSLDFVQSHAEANKLQIIKDLATGVQYVHSIGKVLGNIHPDNVMITSDYRAVLMDAGLSPFTDQMSLDSNGRIRIPDSWPYKPAEELYPLGATSGVVVTHTPAMDVYSFAVTAYSIFATTTPLTAQRYTTEQWLVKIHENGHDHLKKPVDMEQSLWSLLQKCLARDPSQRPDMAAVANVLDDMGY